MHFVQEQELLRQYEYKYREELSFVARASTSTSRAAGSDYSLLVRQTLLLILVPPSVDCSYRTVPYCSEFGVRTLSVPNPAVRVPYKHSYEYE
eukprot:scaffold379544_cov17-Prasinocladus_malaysianus.AAC.1